MKHYSKNNSAEKVALFVIGNHLNPEEITPYLTKSDQNIMAIKGVDYLSLTKLSKKPYTDLTVAADVVLSDSAHKVDLNSNQGVVSASVVKEGDGWVVFWNLKENYEINDLLAQIKDAELREDEFEMLSLYKKMQEKMPADYYADKIKLLESYIAKKKKQEEYVKNIYVEEFKLVGRVLTAVIKNQGSEKVKSIKGKLQIVNPADGSIQREVEISVYDLIPGSFVYGEAIAPGFQKKIGLNVEPLPEITDKTTVYISVTAVEFME